MNQFWLKYFVWWFSRLSVLIDELEWPTVSEEPVDHQDFGHKHERWRPISLVLCSGMHSHTATRNILCAIKWAVDLWGSSDDCRTDTNSLFGISASNEQLWWIQTSPRRSYQNISVCLLHVSAHREAPEMHTFPCRCIMYSIQYSQNQRSWIINRLW